MKEDNYIELVDLQNFWNVFTIISCFTLIVPAKLEFAKFLFLPIGIALLFQLLITIGLYSQNHIGFVTLGSLYLKLMVVMSLIAIFTLVYATIFVPYALLALMPILLLLGFAITGMKLFSKYSPNNNDEKT